MREDAGDGRHGGGGQQDQQHRVGELLQKALEIGDLLGLLQAVGAVLFKASGGLLLRKPLMAAALSGQHLLRSH